MQIYEKPTRLLMQDMVRELNISKNDIIRKPDVIDWFKQNYPKIKSNTVACHLIRMSVNANSRHHFKPKLGEDDLFWQIDKSSYRLYDPSKDVVQSKELDENSAHDEATSSEYHDEAKFAYEKDLQSFLEKNLTLIEGGLYLYDEDGISGVEYNAGGRFIDILAVDSNNNFVVIELKVSRGYDRVVGQLLRYVSWVRKNLCEPGQSVRGVIIARDISEDLVLACEGLSDVVLFEYEMSIKINKIEKV